MFQLLPAVVVAETTVSIAVTADDPQFPHPLGYLQAAGKHPAATTAMTVTDKTPTTMTGIRINESPRNRNAIPTAATAATPRTQMGTGAVTWPISSENTFRTASSTPRGSKKRMTSKSLKCQPSLASKHGRWRSEQKSRLPAAVPTLVYSGH